MFVCQNDRKYNQNFETELNLNDLERLTTEDEIRMDDQDEHAIDQVRRWQWYSRKMTFAKQLFS